MTVARSLSIILPTIEDMLIANVESHSPADYAGLRKGDIIETVDGRRIDDRRYFIELEKEDRERQIIMSVNRFGRRFVVPIQLQNRP